MKRSTICFRAAVRAKVRARRATRRAALNRRAEAGKSVHRREEGTETE